MQIIEFSYYSNNADTKNILSHWKRDFAKFERCIMPGFPVPMSTLSLFKMVVENPGAMIVGQHSVNSLLTQKVRIIVQIDPCLLDRYKFIFFPISVQKVWFIQDLSKDDVGSSAYRLPIVCFRFSFCLPITFEMLQMIAKKKN